MIIKAVKSPSPSRRVVETRVTPKASPPPFRDPQYHSEVHLQAGLTVAQEEFEDWEPQVGTVLHPPQHPPTLLCSAVHTLVNASTAKANQRTPLPSQIICFIKDPSPMATLLTLQPVC